TPRRPSAADGADGAGADDLVDERSGLVVRRGAVLALVSAQPDETAATASRLGRFDDAAPDDGTGDGTPGCTPDVVHWGATALTDLDLAEVRDRIVVAESTPHLFTGLLAEELDVRGRATEEDLLHAMHVADAADVLDSVPGGLGGEVEEKGRSLSGGQRQRVALARALLTEAEVLVLVEPTSAVDAHSESRIAQRLVEARRGRTTVLVTASPLVLDHVDEVVLVEGGRVRARGHHRALLADTGTDGAGAAYRAVVSRSPAATDADTDLTTDTTAPFDREEAGREAARR
ncbi:MAG TPA: ABC transporter ATP-binding protein, partial [Cellulomonas sp.]